MQIDCEDGRVLEVGADDAAVLCTGQRVQGAGEGSYQRRAEYNKGGLFHVAPYTNQSPINALYMLYCLIAYLEGTPCAYNDGRVAAAFERQAQYMETIKDRSPWGRFWANMGGVEYDVGPLVYDRNKFRSITVDAYYRWSTDWFARSVKVRHAFSLLEMDQAASSTPLSNGDRSNNAVVLFDSTNDAASPSLHCLKLALALAQQLVGVSRPPCGSCDA